MKQGLYANIHAKQKRIANKVDELGDGDPVYTWWVAEQIRAEGDKQ